MTVSSDAQLLQDCVLLSWNDIATGCCCTINSSFQELSRNMLLNLSIGPTSLSPICAFKGRGSRSQITFILLLLQYMPVAMWIDVTCICFEVLDPDIVY